MHKALEIVQAPLSIEVGLSPSWGKSVVNQGKD